MTEHTTVKEIHFKEEDTDNFLSKLYPCTIREGEEEWDNAASYFVHRQNKEEEEGGWMRYELDQSEQQSLDTRAMRRVLHEKFRQNPELQEKLLATGDAEIVLDTVSDPFWGVAEYFSRNSNQMGYLLQELRTTLRKEQQSSDCAQAKEKPCRESVIRFNKGCTTHFLSNLYPCMIREGEKEWLNAEMYFNWKTDRALGSRMRYELRKEEAEVHDSRVMRQVLLTKFTQHPELQEKLLATGEARLEYSTDYDPFWGMAEARECASQNELGRLLMKLRAQLKKKRDKEKRKDTLELYTPSLKQGKRSWPQPKKRRVCCAVCAAPFPDSSFQSRHWLLLCPACSDHNDMSLSRLQPPISHV